VSKLPRISGRQCMAALLRAGFIFKRQEGSHMILGLRPAACGLRPAGMTEDEMPNDFPGLRGGPR
jgi:hypothetical protein